MTHTHIHVTGVGEYFSAYPRGFSQAHTCCCYLRAKNPKRMKETDRKINDERAVSAFTIIGQP